MSIRTWNRTSAASLKIPLYNTTSPRMVCSTFLYIPALLMINKMSKDGTRVDYLKNGTKVVIHSSHPKRLPTGQRSILVYRKVEIWESGFARFLACQAQEQQMGRIQGRELKVESDKHLQIDDGRTKVLGFGSHSRWLKELWHSPFSFGIILNKIRSLIFREKYNDHEIEIE